MVDPDNPYPKGYTGHIRMTLRDGRVFEERQAHIRSGSQEPLSRDDIEAKFRGNATSGGWGGQRANEYLRFARSAFGGKVDFSAFRG